MKKIILILGAMTILSSCSFKKKTYADFTMDFLDVGKADCMVLRSENGTVVIDCGEKGDGKKIIELLSENNIDSVDYLIITHYDKDHVGGSAKLINEFEVKNVLAPDYEENSSEVKKYLKALDENNITPILIKKDFSFTLDEVEYTIYAPQKNFYGEDDDNDFSLVTKVDYHNTTMLFAGDAMEQRLEEIMNISECDLLKVPYHGREIDNFETFLCSANPEYAVVCSSKSEFSGETEKLLKKYNIEYYSTCYNGNITAISNGNKLSFTTEK